MALINRIQRLLRADVHAILDAVEEPEAVLKQAIREMQEALDLKRAGMERRHRILDALAQHETSLRSKLEKAEADLQLALGEAGEELAKKILTKKLSLEKRLASTRQRIAGLHEACRRQEAEISEQQNQLDSILEKAKGFVQVAAEDSPSGVAESILGFHEAGGDRQSGVGADEVELEWLRLKKERGGQS